MIPPFASVDSRHAAPWWLAFKPRRTAVSTRERWRIAVGAALGIAFTVWVSRAIATQAGVTPWLMAPIGASAVLVFAAASSPFAHPWAVLGGHLAAASAGIVCLHWLGDPMRAAAPAVGLAILLMLALRCLHPPGGGTALLTVLTGVHQAHFLLLPVATNAVLLVLAAIAWHRLTGRRYPAPPPQAVDPRDATLDADLDAVLSRLDQVLTISREDLKALLLDTRMQTYQRQLARVRCGDIMSRRLVTMADGTSLAEAWALFRRHRIKALPVVNAQGALVGIVTPADLMREAEREAGAGAGNAQDRLQRLHDLAASPEQVAAIMTRQVRVAQVDQRLVDLLPLFAGSGHHHLPIVDHDGRLVGIVTQSDVVAALSGSVPEAP